MPETGNHVPEVGALLPFEKAYHIRKENLRGLKNRTDVWPILYGTRLGTAVVILSSFVIHVNARQLLHLYSHNNFWSTLFPSLLFSGVTYWVSFEDLVIQPILTRFSSSVGGTSACDICLEIRGSFLQMFCGAILPGALSFLTCNIAALAERTYPVPSLSNPKELWMSTRRFCRGLRVTGPALLLVHCVTGSLLTACVIKANWNVVNAEKQLSSISGQHPPSKE